MSNQTYSDMLKDIFSGIKQQMNNENPPSMKVSKQSFKNKKVFKKHYEKLYINYILILRKLEECYDHIRQPQQREDLKVVLESIIIRLLNVTDILKVIWGEYIDFDETLIELRKIPSSITIPIPKYFKEEIENEIKRRDLLINYFMDLFYIQDQSKKEVFDFEDFYMEMSVEDAVKIIQRNERGRQSRHATKYKRGLKIQEERVRRVVERGQALQVDFGKAAVIVQRIWKGYITRKRVKEMLLKELEFLGMKESDNKEYLKLRDLLKIVREKRKLTQKQNKKDLDIARIKMKEKIMSEEAPDIIQDLKNEIMEKYFKLKKINGNKEVYFPSEKDGGSKTFMSEEKPVKIIEREKERNKQLDGKSSRKGKSEKKTKGDDSNFLKDLPETKSNIASCVSRYLNKWGLEIPRYENYDEKYDPIKLRKELMEGGLNRKGEPFQGIREEIRVKIVDPEIRSEIEKLNINPKKIRIPKKKKEKDSEDSSAMNEQKKVDLLLGEFIKNEICQKYHKYYIDDYIGTHNINGSLQPNCVEPSEFQVKQLLSEIILTFGTKRIHSKSPSVKSLLICGPNQSGKTMLTKILANEIGAIWFDLSIHNIQHKFKGKKMQMIKLLFQIARKFQPAVIYIDEIEQLFPKKKKVSISKIRKELQAQIKSIKNGERILVVGNSSYAWEGKQMSQFFDKIICTTIPNYASRNLLFRTLIQNKVGRFKSVNFDYQTLSYVTKGYTSGDIARVIEQVMTLRRVKRLKIRTLKIDEFIGPLSKLRPILPDQYEKMKKFMSSLSSRKRKKTNKEILEEKEMEISKKSEKKGVKTRVKKKTV